MSEQTAVSHDACKPCKDCLRAERDCDILIFCGLGMSATWLAWVIISVIELV